MPAKLRDARPTGDRLLRLPEVIASTGRSKAGIYCLIREGTFPAPLLVGKRAVAWPESRVEAWKAARVERTYAPLPATEPAAIAAPATKPKSAPKRATRPSKPKATAPKRNVALPAAIPA